MQGWVDLVGLVTYQGGIPARRRSPIPALTGLNAEQLRSCDERRYHNAKPPNREETAPVECILSAATETETNAEATGRIRGVDVFDRQRRRLKPMVDWVQVQRGE